MSPLQAAEWMVTQIKERGYLYQEEAYDHLAKKGDQDLAYVSEAGSYCIGKKVLRAFNKLTPEIVYERSDQMWRPRVPGDLPGRQQ